MLRDKVDSQVLMFTTIDIWHGQVMLVEFRSGETKRRSLVACVKCMTPERMRIFEIKTISKLHQIPWHNFVCDLAFLPGIDNAVEELGEWLRKVYPARSNTWSCSIDIVVYDVDYVPRHRSKLADLHHLDHWDVCSVGVCYSLLQNRSRVSSSKKVL